MHTLSHRVTRDKICTRIIFTKMCTFQYEQVHQIAYTETALKSCLYHSRVAAHALLTPQGGTVPIVEGQAGDGAAGEPSRAAGQGLSACTHDNTARVLPRNVAAVNTKLTWYRPVYIVHVMRDNYLL